MRQKTVITKLSQSVTEAYYKRRQVLQNMTEVYYEVRQVLQSATVVTKWDVTTFQWRHLWKRALIWRRNILFTSYLQMFSFYDTAVECTVFPPKQRDREKERLNN